MTTDERLAEIHSRLERAFAPEMLSVEDEGHLHAGHEGAKDGRGHFRLSMVSQSFNGMKVLARHRAIYEQMGSLMESDIHALSIEAFASDEI
ncbi:MAG: BolA protein [Lysobacterales bacterium]